jgi:hypothetical protein
MDDIDAAVEDAEYIRAMRIGTPQPTKGWEWLSPAELETYMEELSSKNSPLLLIENVVSNSLGFYLVNVRLFCCVVVRFKVFFLILFYIGIISL